MCSKKRSAGVYATPANIYWQVNHIYFLDAKDFGLAGYHHTVMGEIKNKENTALRIISPLLKQ